MLILAFGQTGPSVVTSELREELDEIKHDEGDLERWWRREGEGL